MNVLEICIINAFFFSKGFSKGYLILEVPNMTAIILQGYYATQVGSYLPKRRLKTTNIARATQQKTEGLNFTAVDA